MVSSSLLEMTANKRIEELAQQFLAQLVDLAREEVMQLLGSGTSSTATKRAIPKTNGTKKPRGPKKGQKRDPADLEALEAKVLTFIKGHPGLRIEQINAELRTNTKQLQLPIRKLLAAKVIKATGKRRATKYAASNKK